MKALDLTKRINRARRRGLDTTVLERELAEVKRQPPPKKEKPARAIAKMPTMHRNLVALLREATRAGYQLGWVMFEFKKRYGCFPGRALWKATVGRDTRDKIIDAHVEKVAKRARAMQW